MARKDALLNLRQVLTEKKENLAKDIAGQRKILEECGGTSSFDELAQQTARGLIEALDPQYRAVCDVLELMQEGAYGMCAICETDIPLARLQALPHAELCVGCQREAETSGDSNSRHVDWSKIIDLETEGADPVVLGAA